MLRGTRTWSGEVYPAVGSGRAFAVSEVTGDLETETPRVVRVCDRMESTGYGSEATDDPEQGGCAEYS